MNMYQRLTEFLKQAAKWIGVGLLFLGVSWMFGSFREKENIHDLSYLNLQASFQSLQDEELIQAAISAEQRAARAKYFWDFLDENDRRDFTIMTTFGGKAYDQVLRLVCWGSYNMHPSHVAGGTAQLLGMYETFHAVIAPRERFQSTHSLILRIVADQEVLFTRSITADTTPFAVELDIRGRQQLTLEVQSDNHSDGVNPGILIKNAYLD